MEMRDRDINIEIWEGRMEGDEGDRYKALECCILEGGSSLRDLRTEMLRGPCNCDHIAVRDFFYCEGRAGEPDAKLYVTFIFSPTFEEGEEHVREAIITGVTNATAQRIIRLLEAA